METQKETAIIEGSGHVYEFEVMDTIHGLGLFHEYATIITSHASDFVSVIQQFLGEDEISDETTLAQMLESLTKGDSAIVNCVKLISEIVSTKRLFDLCSVLLPGASIDNEKCDERGLCSLFRRRPHEAYIALFWAIVANYGDYFPFLEQKEDTEGKD